MEKLSAIELAVLRGLANGLQSKELASQLDRSKSTIEFHVRALLAKFNARSRANLVARAIYAGILERDHFDREEAC